MRSAASGVIAHLGGVAQWIGGLGEVARCIKVEAGGAIQCIGSAGGGTSQVVGRFSGAAFSIGVGCDVACTVILPALGDGVLLFGICRAFGGAGELAVLVVGVDGGALLGQAFGF